MKNFDMMPWNERMKTEIQIGKYYKNRNDITVKVIGKVDDKFHVMNEGGTYDHSEYGNGYLVDRFGGFGNYPNPYDLIKNLI
jgi:hypothetical protein